MPTQKIKDFVRRRPLNEKENGSAIDVAAVIIEIFDRSQYPGTCVSALEDIKKVYDNTDNCLFKKPFTDCLRKLLQAEHNHYFKSSCHFVCKFLDFVSKKSDVTKPEKKKNANPRRKSTKHRQSKKFKPDDSGSEDELVAGLIKKGRSSLVAPTSVEEVSESDISITVHDRLISSCADIACLYRQVIDDRCRLNGVFFIYKFLSCIESLDEGIISSIKKKSLMSLRDKKPMTRAYAVLALRAFQGDELIKKGFRYHLEFDPDLSVRRALLKIMDPKEIGHKYLIASTRDPCDVMRKIAYQRLEEVTPEALKPDQLHRIIHNGLNERDKQVAHKFKTGTLWPWLSNIYDGLDLHKMLEIFDVVDYAEDIQQLLETIYDHDLQQVQSNGASTRLHHVVETFRERWLEDAKCLPNVAKVDERLVMIWFTLVKFLKSNHPIIKPVTIRTVRHATDQDESIEQMLDSQENRDETIELYERLCPDLVNLVDFLNEYIHYVEQQLDEKKITPERAEFIYLQMIEFISTLEVGDELERKKVQEVFDTILKESKLIQHFDSSNFIPPIMKCLYKLVYSKSSNLMVNYISELIQNVRSHLEDISEPSSELDPVPIFNGHSDELIKCLQMYFGCLQYVRIREVPETMLAHLRYLSFEALESENQKNTKARCLMVACNGITAIVDENFAKTDPACMDVLASSCHDPSSISIRTIGFKCLVDVLCEHGDIDLPERCEEFLLKNLENYGKFDPDAIKKEDLEFITAVITGTTKMFYFQKLKSPDLLSFLILWWYHPSTPSKLKQFIGVFLPVFVNDLIDQDHMAELLINTFVTTIETFHSYILEKAHDTLIDKDLLNVISFLSNLIPTSLHAGVVTKVEEKIGMLGEDTDERNLQKFLEKSLTSIKFIQ